MSQCRSRPCGGVIVPDRGTGALVDVVGCLMPVSGNTWVLTSASEPVRTRNPNDSTAEQLKEWGAKPLGTLTFGLMDADAHPVDTLKGHRVEAKGFMIRASAGDRINLTALQSTGSKCAE